MAIPPFPLIWGFLLLSAVYAVGSSIYQNITRRQKAKAWGCLPPKSSATKLFGYDNYRNSVAASRESKLLPFFNDLVLQYGATFSHTILGSPGIITTEPENIKTILATKFNDFSLGNRHRAMGIFLGNGVFTLDGAGWSHSRTMLRPQFSRDQVADVAMLSDHVSQLIALIPSDGTPVDIQELFFRLTLDTATEFLFGQSTHCLLEGKQPQQGESDLLAGIGGEQRFAYAFNRSQDFCTNRTRAQNLYWLVNDAESRKAVKLVHDVVDHYVDLALKRNQRRHKSASGLGGSGGEEEKLIDSSHEESRYVFLDAMVSETQDRKVLRDQMLNILLAGRDTTSSLLSSAFFYLARHQRVWERLSQEVRSAFDTNANEDITIAKLRDVRYLRHFLNEVLRLQAPVPINGRAAVVDTMLPLGGGPDGKSPLFIPKGGRVTYSVNSMHRRKDLWGADAEEFRPERWEEDGRHGWEFLPFNGGPRICLGQQYALAEASYTLVRLLQRFDRIENAQPEIVQPKNRIALTLSHADGVVVRLFAN